ASVRCVWVDITLAQAQVNMVERLLTRFGSLPGPSRLRDAARREPGLLTPTQQMRAVREFEAPAADEGFTEVVRVPFERASSAHGDGAGAFVATDVLETARWREAVAPIDGQQAALVFAWRPDGNAAAVAAAAERLMTRVPGIVERAVCLHGGGPPLCWCRPPLPGLLLAFTRRHALDPTRCVLIGVSAAHRTLAATLGARFVDATPE
ncbi:MAG: hypothetical protein ABR498_00210, partial [Candidatus Dormibacteria bacterium]